MFIIIIIVIIGLVLVNDNNPASNIGLNNKGPKMLAAADPQCSDSELSVQTYQNIIMRLYTCVYVWTLACVCRSCAVVRRSWSARRWSRSLTRSSSASASSSWRSGSRTCSSENYHCSSCTSTRTRNPTSRNAKEPSKSTSWRLRTGRRSACHRVRPDITAVRVNMWRCLCLLFSFKAHEWTRFSQLMKKCERNDSRNVAHTEATAMMLGIVGGF